MRKVPVCKYTAMVYSKMKWNRHLADHRLYRGTSYERLFTGQTQVAAITRWKLFEQIGLHIGNRFNLSRMGHCYGMYYPIVRSIILASADSIERKPQCVWRGSFCNLWVISERLLRQSAIVDVDHIVSPISNYLTRQTASTVLVPFCQGRPILNLSFARRLRAIYGRKMQ